MLLKMRCLVANIVVAGGRSAKVGEANGIVQLLEACQW